MSHYQFEREGELVDVEVKWTGEGYEARIGQRTWKINPVDVSGEEGGSGDTGSGLTSSPRKERKDKSRPASGGGGELLAPIAGKVLEIYVSPGDVVSSEDLLLKMESMKLETELPAGADGKISEILVSEGDSIEEGDQLVIIEEE